MKKGYMLAFGITMMVSACDKKDNTPTPPVEPPITQVTRIAANNNGDPNPRQIQLSYKDQSIGVYDISASGNVKITFHGLNGRSILGAYRGTTNLANFKIQNGDTVRVVTDGVSKDYITDIWDGINSGIVFTSNSSETEAQAKARFDLYVRDVLPTQKFKKSP